MIHFSHTFIQKKNKMESPRMGLWTADTALDKMKNTYFIYKNSIFKRICNDRIFGFIRQ